MSRNRPICTECSEPFELEPFEADHVNGGEYYSTCDCDVSNDVVISMG